MRTRTPFAVSAEVKTVAILTFVGIAIFATASAAAVYHSRESALELAFGQDAEVTSQELFLSKQEQAAAGKLAGSDIPSRLIRRYEGRQDGQLLGYAYFETHLVRSLPETLMIVVDPEGRVIGVHMLAFHEPEEYLPRDWFMEQFAGRELDKRLSVRTDLKGIAGSTFTAIAINGGVRRVLATHQTLNARTAGRH